MTKGQILIIDSVRAKLQECREELDRVMYRTVPITDEEYERCRKIYNAICKALDEM